MSTLSDLLEAHTALRPGEIGHLQLLVGDWQLLADLSFADLLMWCVTTEGDLLCVAQTRPTTGPTAHDDDLVGVRQPFDAELHLAVALRERRICRETDPDWQGDLPVRREGIPIRRGGSVVGVLSRDTNLAAARSPSALELAYLQGAAELCQMIAEGRFPPGDGDAGQQGEPRVGDGLLRLDGRGTVTYASPNALSAYRRLGVAGDVLGQRLPSLTEALAPDSFEAGLVSAAIRSALRGGSPGRLEMDAHGVTILVRALPLRPGGRREGALVLIRDVTDLRSRDRELSGKDATIREIHHRVKNNLQTVAALLRLQARRVGGDDARLALQESVRRVSSIAVVHETLALAIGDQVDFDAILDRLLSMVAEVAAPESTVVFRREGAFGELPGDIATPLAMVLTELMQNAVEHAFVGTEGGTVLVRADRLDHELGVLVADDGTGLPDGFDLASSDRLGLQIVRTLVGSELRGRIELASAPGGDRPGGTEARLRLPLLR